MKLTVAFSAAAARRPRILVVIPPEDVKDVVLKADGLRQSLAPATDTAVIGAAGTFITADAVAALSAARDAGDETRSAVCPKNCLIKPL
jgi:hypothetical protein